VVCSPLAISSGETNKWAALARKRECTVGDSILACGHDFYRVRLEYIKGREQNKSTICTQTACCATYFILQRRIKVIYARKYLLMHAEIPTATPKDVFYKANGKTFPDLGKSNFQSEF
jgi:hypothetical protein